MSKNVRSASTGYRTTVSRRVISPAPVSVVLEAGALETAEASGAVAVRLSTPMNVATALALVRDSLPTAKADVQGWALACPAGCFVPLRPKCAIKVGALRVRKGDLLMLNFAWRSPTGRVAVRCHAAPTADRPEVWPVDLYEEQIGSIAGLEGKPLEFPGWELVRHDPDAFKL